MAGRAGSAAQESAEEAARAWPGLPPGEGKEGVLLPALVQAGPAAGRTRLRGRSAGYRQPDRMRGRIQTGVLITRLQKISKGLVSGSPPQLMCQIAAAKVLLAKALPDLQTVTLAGDADAPLIILTRME